MASCIVVQLGQCGTQVGHQLFSVLHEDATKSSIIASCNANAEYEQISLQTFFNETSAGKKEARSVMVDMEPKAVASALQNTAGKTWSYAKNQQFWSRSGSGNNWSYGYKVHAPKCKEAVLEIARKETEKCDHFGGFLILSSLAGGTGSGLGSFVTEMLRDTFPRAAQVSSVVCPYTDGEVAVQNYNAVLSLAHTSATADASILLHNDQLHSICSKLLGIKNVSFKDINNVIANQLASILQPVTFGSCPSSYSFNVLNSLVSTVACHSHYGMLDLKSLPHIPQKSVAFSTYAWDALLKRIYQMLITDFYMDEGIDWHRKLPLENYVYSAQYPKYISNLLLMRGHHALSLESNLSNFHNDLMYPKWMPQVQRCPVWKTNIPLQKFEKSITLLSNGTSCIKPLDKVVGKAWNMYNSRAYCHQYTKHGLEEEDFINAFVAVENVISAYKQL